METLELEELDYLVHESEEEDDEMPSFTHGQIQLRLLNTLNSALEQKYEAYPPITFQGAKRRYTPDVAIFPKRVNTRQKTYLVEKMPPLLAIEIISPGQTMMEMVFKCAEMLESGVKECWIAEPANDTVTVCREDTQFVRHRGESLEYSLCTRVLTVDEIFDV
jgi:Uma2 family endonuclease